MKITKEQWEEIVDYIFEHSKEIWDMAVTHTSHVHDAKVWLDIEGGNYKLWAGRYTTGTVENPKNIFNSLLVYELSKNWQDEVSNDDLCIEWVNGRPKRTRDHSSYDYKNDERNFLSDEEYGQEVYEVGYELFLEELHDDWFWYEVRYTNGIEIVE